MSNGVVEVKPERMMNQRKRRETARRTRPARPRGASATGQLSVGKAIQNKSGEVIMLPRLALVST